MKEATKNIAEVDEQDGQHHEKRDAKAKFFPNQITQAFARDRAHAGGDFLHHDQSQRDRNHGPKQLVAELCPSLRVRDDAVCIIVHVRGNEPRTDNSEEQQDPDFPAFQESHACNYRK